jgi:hypothetical protein
LEYLKKTTDLLKITEKLKTYSRLSPGSLLGKHDGATSGAGNTIYLSGAPRGVNRVAGKS